jgi:hypothetical protein
MGWCVDWVVFVWLRLLALGLCLGEWWLGGKPVGWGGAGLGMRVGVGGVVRGACRLVGRGAVVAAGARDGGQIGLRGGGRMSGRRGPWGG